MAGLDAVLEDGGTLRFLEENKNRSKKKRKVCFYTAESAKKKVSCEVKHLALSDIFC